MHNHHDDYSNVFSENLDLDPSPSFEIDDNYTLDNVIYNISEDLLSDYGLEIILCDDTTIGVRQIDGYYNRLDAIKYIYDAATDDLSKDSLYQLIKEIINGGMYNSKVYLDSQLDVIRKV